MTLDEVIKNILEHYGEGDENKPLRDIAFKRVTKYYFEHCVYINGEPIFRKVWSASEYSCPAIFKKKKAIYSFGCTGSWLQHMGSFTRDMWDL